MCAGNPKPSRRRFQYGVRTLLIATAFVAILLSLFAWQQKRAEYQKRCIQAIRHRGGFVRYDFEGDSPWPAKSRVPQLLLDWLGIDFFHRVAHVWIGVLLPCDWDPPRERSAFEEGCLAIDSKVPDDWQRWGSSDAPRKVIWPENGQLSADDWSRAALRQYQFGCDKITFYRDYCRKSLELDPNNVQAGRDFLKCAERFAQSRHEADLRSAVSRAYYGAFHEALALLRDNGIQLPRTEQVHVKITYCLQDCGESLAEDAGHLLQFLRTQRKRADCELDDARFANTTKVQSEIARAGHIVDELDQCRKVADFRDKVRAQAKLLGLPVSE